MPEIFNEIRMSGGKMTHQAARNLLRRGRWILLLLAFVTVAWSVQAALARTTNSPLPQETPLHPTFPLLDADGRPVLESGEPVSTMKTCGECHDTAFISQHSDHANLGLDGLPLPGELGALVTDPQTGLVKLWTSPPAESLEMNCFLCHTPSPNGEARAQALFSGNDSWASTASLLGSGIVEQTGDQYTYNPAAFAPDGELLAEVIKIQDPSNENCALCHGTVHTETGEPLVLQPYTPENFRSGLTGQVISSERISSSGVNLANKESLARSWDVHAERMLQCTDCHFALNNPVYYEGNENARPDHLAFDPRRLEINEYLRQPLHQFASGETDDTAPFGGTMRSCAGCHETETAHAWLPYAERHFEAVSCQTCHIPQVFSAAFQQLDWTVLSTSGEPRASYRGVEGEGTPSVETLIVGYEPVLLPRPVSEGVPQAGPYNLVSTWYWVAGEPAQPVNLDNLKAAWFDGDRYHPEVAGAFDANGDGSLQESELALDTPEKQALIAGRLAQQGLVNPRITGEVQAYPVNHGTAEGRWVTRDCQTCHSQESQLAAPVKLASYIPGGVLPELDASLSETGSLSQTQDGALFYQPKVEDQGLYVLGHSAVGWIDLLGSLVFAGVMLGVAAHGGYRVYSLRRRPRPKQQLKRVYMYAMYERLWHWLQTFAILLLLFTGLIIHKPDTFGIFSFRYVVLVHNILAGILVTNAALSLFYHLVSGDIRQYIPRPVGFFDQAIVQAKYYLKGIFQGKPHPIQKTPDQKLNPLQQVTYFAILNVLLPLQVITGALMWGTQQWPEWTARLGGLPFLAPFHTLIAWLFASFILMHVYLTTTGHLPLANIQAMMMGWDEVEVHEAGQEELALSLPVTEEINS